jgi:hypothetical protein
MTPDSQPEDTVHVAVRVPRAIHEALLDEQRQASKRAGIAVRLSDVVRFILERGLGKKPRKALR